MKIQSWKSPSGFSSRIFEYWITIFDREFHIIIEPKEYKLCLKNLGNLMDDDKFEEFKIQIELAYQRWDTTPDLIRLQTLCSFMQD